MAVLVSHERGLADEAPLHHTGDDVRRMADVLRELGEFADTNVQVIANQPASTVLRALDALLARDDISLLFVYFSGHADASALHLGGTRLPMNELLARVARAPSKLQLLVLDACQSGGANRGKGSTEGPAFDVPRLEMLPEGQIVITSSAADEYAYESDMHHGALFTNHWIAALRGAADSNGDGQVSLAEAYNYAYAQTLRDTLMSRGGPQHATFRWGVTGQREPVLTYLRGDASLTLLSDEDGDYIVFSGDERMILTELPLGAGKRARLSLTAGDYVIKKRSSDALSAVAVHLTRGDDRELYDRHMRQVPFVRLAQKGSWGTWRMAAGMGQYAAGLGPRGPLYVSGGVEAENHAWLYGSRVVLSLGNQERNALRTEDNFAGVQAYALSLQPLGLLTWGVGPTLGALYWHQQTDGQAPRASFTGLVGMHTELVAPVWERWSVALNADLALHAVRSNDRVGKWGLRTGDIAWLPWAAYGIEVRAWF